MNEELFTACRKGNLESVKELLAEGIDPNITDNLNRTPLHVVYFDMFHDNFEEYINPSPEYIKNHLAIVRELLMKGADPNIAENLHHRTPLWGMCADRYSDVVNELLANGADPNICDIPNQSMLEWASFVNNSEEVIKALREYFPTLQMLSLRYIRKYRINIVRISPELYCPEINDTI